MRARGTSSTIIITWNLHSLSFRKQLARWTYRISASFYMYVVSRFQKLLKDYNIVPKWSFSSRVYVSTFRQASWFGFVLLIHTQMHSFYITIELVTVKTESRSVFDSARGIVFVSMFLNILVDSRKLLPLCSLFIELNWCIDGTSALCVIFVDNLVRNIGCNSKFKPIIIVVDNRSHSYSEFK